VILILIIKFNIVKVLQIKMLSVNYSLNCVTFDPKGKILQVSHPS